MTHCNLTEFVGTAVLDTIGLVIPSVDSRLHSFISQTLPIHEATLSAAAKNYKSLGVFSSRTGAAGQINAIDEAVKSTNSEVVSIQLPRDTKGWGGHGNFIILGSDHVSDVRRAMEIALEYTNKYAGELYISQAGHLEFTYSANAGGALHHAFHAPIGRPFGFMCGSPAAIGLVMADLCLKSSDIEIIGYMTPNYGTSHSNEVILTFTGDASAVKNAVLHAREVGLSLLCSMGSEPKSPGTSYLFP